MPWEEGKKLPSNSLILTASWVKDVERIKVKELNIETLSSPRSSADLSHITQMVFDGLSRPVPATGKQGKSNRNEELPNEEIKQQQPWEGSLDHLQDLHKVATWISIPKCQQLLPKQPKK